MKDTIVYISGNTTVILVVDRKGNVLFERRGYFAFEAALEELSKRSLTYIVKEN